MPDTIIAQIKVRSDTAANWQKVNPVLETGEIGFDTTNNQIKIGNMGLSWNALSAINTGFSYTTITNPVNNDTGNNNSGTSNNQQGDNSGTNNENNNQNNQQQQGGTYVTSSLIVYDDNIRRTSSSYEPAYIRLYNLFISENNITNNLNIYPYNVSVFDHVIMYTHLKISQADPQYSAYSLSLLKNIVNDSIIIVGQDRSAQFTSLFINNPILWDTNINSTIVSVSGPEIIEIYDTMLYNVKKYDNAEVQEYLNIVHGEYRIECIQKVIDVYENAINLDPNSVYALTFNTLNNTILRIQLIKQNIQNIAMSFGY